MKKENLFIAFIRIVMMKKPFTKGFFIQNIFAKESKMGKIDPAWDNRYKPDFESIAVDTDFIVSDYTTSPRRHTNVCQSFFDYLNQRNKREIAASVFDVVELRDYINDILPPENVQIVKENGVRKLIIRNKEEYVEKI